MGNAGENTVSTLGRFVLIINSSYTASLTSILTVQQLSTGIQGLDSLLSSNDPIGYQVGSFARSYMMEELGVPASRLRELAIDDYADSLQRGPSNGGVAAIVDELPYVELFLSFNCPASLGRTSREQTFYPRLKWTLVPAFFASGTIETFSPGWSHQPGLKVLQPLVPVVNTNRD